MLGGPHDRESYNVHDYEMELRFPVSPGPCKATRDMDSSAEVGARTRLKYDAYRRAPRSVAGPNLFIYEGRFG